MCTQPRQDDFLAGMAVPDDCPGHRSWSIRNGSRGRCGEHLNGHRTGFRPTAPLLGFPENGMQRVVHRHNMVDLVSRYDRIEGQRSTGSTSVVKRSMSVIVSSGVHGGKAGTMNSSTPAAA